MIERKIKYSSNVENIEIRCYSSISVALTFSSDIKKVKEINDTWKYVSLLKHGKKTNKEIPLIDMEKLKSIASFDDEVSKSFEKEFNYYEMVKKCFPQF